MARRIFSILRRLLVFVLIAVCTIGHAQNFEAGLPAALKTQLKDLPNDTSKINFLLSTSDMVMQKDPTQAITLTLYALSLARKAGAATQTDQALAKAGKILQLNGAYDKAMDYYNEYYQRALKSGNIKNQLKARHNIASLKMTISGKFDAALYEEMSALLKAYNQIWDSERDSVFIKEFIPGILINLNYVAQLRDSLAEAVGYLQSVRSLADQNLLSEQVQLQLSVSEITVFIKNGKYREALERIDQAVTLCRLTNNQVMEASIDFYAGNAWMGLGNRQPAMEAYKNCYSKGEQLGNFILVAEAASKLAALYEQNGDLASALKYKNKAEQAKAAMQKPEAAAKANSAQMLEKVSRLEGEMEQFTQKSTLRLTLLLAILLLVGIGSAAAYSISRKSHQKISEEKRSLEEQSVSALQEIEALGSELENKDKQLATEMMYRLQQQEQIKDIRQRLLLVNRHAKKEVKEELEKVIKGIELSSEDISWKDFELRFLQVHQDFYDRLHAINPKLSGNERRLCAFLKMGFNTKEISTITGQSQQSIIMSRHRLRKKLGLEHQNTSFDEFFAGF